MTVIFYGSDESEEAVSSTSWIQVASVSGEVDTNSEHMLWVNCEYAGMNVGEVVGVRVLIDGVERGVDHFNPVLSGQFRTFSPFGMIVFSEGIHTVSLEARCLDISQTVKVRRKRLLVMKH